MKKRVLWSLILLVSFGLNAQNKKLFLETAVQKESRMAWWKDARFGMFIHWGLYALPARGEWVRNREKITNEAYEVYFENFNPDKFNPVLWAKEAKAAGMKYVVLTAKHHEGFCLFDSKYTDYKATNTPIRKDLIRAYVDAFRAEGIKIGFYYSLVDWHHPDFTIDKYHPLRLEDKASEEDWTKLNKGRDMNRYRTYMFNQITELLTNYGKIDILWLDFSYPGKNGKGKDDWSSVDLIRKIKKLQPSIIVDNRMDLGNYSDAEDFETPEQIWASDLYKYRGKTWETCQTFSGSWGYNRDENSWKNNRQLLDLLITSTANGGNLILNVGPTGRGEFDPRAKTALDSISKWMQANGKSIYGCTFAPEKYPTPAGTKLTFNPKTKKLYVHIFNYPTNGKLLLPGYGSKIRYAQFLHDYSELVTTDGRSIDHYQKDQDVILVLPKRQPDFSIPVVELILK